MNGETGAFVPGSEVRVAGAAEGPLRGLTFVAKDLFDVAGHPTGGGNPAWAAGQRPAEHHAWMVQVLLDAGATLVGKTVTDEVSLGLLGENPHYGTPRNPRAPDRVPGGSSSGTAAAVGAGLAHFGIGTDTGGSVRVPASFSGLWGIRPTHGRLDLTGMMPQAPSSDTAGWLAADPEIFARVGEVVLGEPVPEALPTRLVLAVDAFGFADTEVQAALAPRVRSLQELVLEHGGEVADEVMAPPGLATWARAQRTLQPAEAWETFRPWLEEANPPLAFSVARLLMAGAAVTGPERSWAELVRAEARARLEYLLPPGSVLCLPTTPMTAPPRALSLSETEAVRGRLTCLCAHGGLTGFPQVSIPGAEVDGLPVGLSLVGPRGSDATLLSIGRRLARRWREDTPGRGDG